MNKNQMEKAGNMMNDTRRKLCLKMIESLTEEVDAHDELDAAEREKTETIIYFYWLMEELKKYEKEFQDLDEALYDFDVSRINKDELVGW